MNYHSADLIAKLLVSIQAQDMAAYQLIIVNNSAEEDCGKLAGDRVLILQSGSNLGFGGGCNLGLNWVFERDRSALVWLINPDATLTESALNHAAEFCRDHPTLSIIGTLITEPCQKIWFAGGEFVPETGKIVAKTELPIHQNRDPIDYVETSWVTGCSLLLNLQNFSDCPLFDSAYFLYYEDFDFCRRYAEQGHFVVITDRIHIIHQPSSITRRDPGFKLQHSTASYLLALKRHTSQRVFGYRLSRILFHALRVSLAQPQQAIAIVRGILHFWQRSK